jgi:phosphocarrier protein FPr
VELAREMLQGQELRVEVAAGLDDGALGTDAAAIVDASWRRTPARASWC